MRGASARRPRRATTPLVAESLAITHKLAILDVLARYTLAADGEDAEAYVAAFAEDAELAYEGPDGVETTRVRGLAAIARVFAAQLAHRRGRTRHCTGLPAFDAFDAEAIRSRAPFVVTAVFGREVRTVASGHYRDRWVWVDERPRLLERVVVLDAPLG